MSRQAKILLVMGLVLIGGGVAFLALWDIPPPSQTIEKEIPRDRIGR